MKRTNQKGSATLILILGIALLVVGVVFVLANNSDTASTDPSKQTEVAVENPKSTVTEDEAIVPEGWVEYRSDEYGFSFYHMEGARGPDLGIREYDGNEEVIDSSIYVETVKNAASFNLQLLNCEIDECVEYYEQRGNEREMWTTRVQEVDPAYGAERLFEAIRVEVSDDGSTTENAYDLIASANGRTYAFSPPITSPLDETQETVNQITSTLRFNIGSQ